MRNTWSFIIHQSGDLIFCKLSDFLVPNPLNNQSDLLKIPWSHDFVQDKLDPKCFLKMVDKTPDWNIKSKDDINFHKYPKRQNDIESMSKKR